MKSAVQNTGIETSNSRTNNPNPTGFTLRVCPTMGISELVTSTVCLSFFPEIGALGLGDFIPEFV